MWFDTHAHLFLLSGSGDDESLRPADLRSKLIPVLDLAQKNGVGAIVCPGIDRRTSELAIAIAELFPGLVWAAVGIHPNSASQATAHDWEEICRWATHPTVVAIGETGLDWFRDYTPREIQITWFLRHLELSRQIGKAVIVHCRDAEEDMTLTLREAKRSGNLAGVMHACAAPWETVQQWLDLGMYVSFAGSVTYSNKKLRHIREAARHVPLDRLLIETDSPFLVPEPLRGREKVCFPSHVGLTGTFIAQIRGLSVAEFAEATSQNASRMFRLVKS